MAVTNHPNFATQATEDDYRTGKSVFRMLGQALQHRFFIMPSYIRCYATYKSFERGVLWHVTNVTAHQFHGIATITAEETVTILRLAGRAIDDGNKIICDDDAVLAFLRGILGDEGLLDYFHAWVMGDG